MIRILMLPLFLIPAACDVPGTPAQEAQEVVQAVKDGDSPGSVGEEAGEVVGAIGREIGGAVEDSVDKAEEKARDGEE